MEDVIFLHAPSVYDFRKKPIFYGPVSDVIPSSPVFEMYPIGFMTISSHLEAAGFRTRIVNIAVQMLQDPRFDVERRIRRLDAKVFAIDLHWMPHAHGALELAKIVKKHHPDAKVELGGFTSSYFHEELILRPEVDMVMRGDTTEAPTVMLMEALSKGDDLSSVPNLVWKDAGGKVHDNGLTYVAEDLDDILFDYGAMIKNTIRHMDIKGALPWLGGTVCLCLGVHGSRMLHELRRVRGVAPRQRRIACRSRPAWRSPRSWRRTWRPYRAI
jgi:B12-binding domain/radical SAM domain protein